MSLTADKIYELIPATYRIRDVEQGEPLKALIEVLAREAGIVEEDIARLYNNWFIETSDEWVIPYIGDLRGVRGLNQIETVPDFSLRAYVANTLRYRRRKGTAPILEQLALDTTRWPSRVVEFFHLLGTTQNLNHLRPQNIVPTNLREMDKLELLNSAFDSTAHTVDVRHINGTNGWYNITNIGLFLWRLQSYRMAKSTARKVTPEPKGFTFSPLGNDINLFNPPQTETEITHLAEEQNVPGLLRRLPLYKELENLRQGIVDGLPEDALIQRGIWFGSNPVLKVLLNGNEIPQTKLLVCNLEEWTSPPNQKAYKNPNGIMVDMPIAAAVDPVLGRITFPTGTAIQKVQVFYNYGFSGDVGGGSYDRQNSTDQWYDPKERPVAWQIGVTKDADILAEAQQPELLVETLQEAIAAWNIHISANPGTFGMITILDNDTYKENLTSQFVIEMPVGSKLAIAAADWPQVDVRNQPGVKQRITGQFVPTDLRPHILGNISVKGTAVDSAPNPGDLVLDGLLVEGKFTVLTGNLNSLLIANSTLVPSKGGLNVNSKNDQLKLAFDYSITGNITLGSPITELQIRNSIVDGNGGDAINAPMSKTLVEKSTIIGKTESNVLEAGNSIFTDLLSVARSQVGCVRFSFVPSGSKTPRRYRCQPELALRTRAEELKLASPADLSADEAALIINVLKPAFTSLIFGHHAWCQLSHSCPEEIKKGAEDGSEMGVFYHLKQPQREANLQVALEEYLNLGLKAGLIFVT
jgi:hypothetical protein